MGLLGLFVSVKLGVHFRPVAQLAEQRSPKPQVGGSIPSWPATYFACLGSDGSKIGKVTSPYTDAVRKLA